MIARIVQFGTRRRVAVLGTLLAALAGAAISYDALAATARDAGVPAVLSWLFPLGVDGMIAVATIAALEVRTRRARAEVWFLLGAAIAVSVIGNAAHAGGRGAVLWGPITTYALWSAVPAAAYAAALHLMVVITRSTHTGKAAPAPRRRGVPVRAGAPARQRRREAPVRLPDGRLVSAGHARKVRARLDARQAA